jgi:hypothetical protein
LPIFWEVDLVSKDLKFIRHIVLWIYNPLEGITLDTVDAADDKVIDEQSKLEPLLPQIESG